MRIIPHNREIHSEDMTCYIEYVGPHAWQVVFHGIKREDPFKTREEARHHIRSLKNPRGNRFERIATGVLE